MQIYALVRPNWLSMPYKHRSFYYSMGIRRPGNLMKLLMKPKSVSCAFFIFGVHSHLRARLQPVMTADDQLKDTLRTMTCCPGALLMKDSPDPEYIWEQDTFTCNLNFRHNSTIDLYNAFSMEEKKDIDPPKKQLPRLGDDRKYKVGWGDGIHAVSAILITNGYDQIDATIVRIMKQRGQVKHPELYASANTQLPFTISVRQVAASGDRSLLIVFSMIRQRSLRNRWSRWLIGKCYENHA